MTLMSLSLRHGRVLLKPLSELNTEAWRRVHAHFRDPEIAHLNGTPPSRMPLWLLRRVLKADSRRRDRETYGIFDVSAGEETYIGTIELYDIRHDRATLGIIIGERSHWSRGFGPEAIEALLTRAFETLDLECVTLSTFGDNERAQAAFKKVGFHEKRRLLTSRGRTDVQMEMSRWAWLEQRAKAVSEHLI
jgi:RimJ/RimL family protein N-acetyltransferase